MNQIRLIFQENNKTIVELSEIENREIAIGRSNQSDIQFSNQTISSKHCTLLIDKGKILIKDLNSTNGTLVNGEKLTGENWQELLLGDKVQFGNSGLCILTLNDSNYQNGKSTIPNESINSKEKSVKTIGRNQDCDIFIDDQIVSRLHASIEKLDDNKYELRDLGSTNGTYFKGKKIVVAQLGQNDLFIVGRNLINVDGIVKRLDEETAIRVENISKVYKNGFTGLHYTSFEIKPKSLTAIMGPSGCGKSTLLKMLNGMIPNTTGKISLFDLELKGNYEYIKRQIGFVPQDDIIHLELTVYESLYYAAKLRLENDTDEEIKSKINVLLAKLKIEKIRNNLNSAISGGQRKRVCIAIELLSDPMILLLDEPTSPLDPQSIEEFLTNLQELAKDKTTIVMVTHKPEDLQFMDEVVFLAEGGHLVYKGEVKDFLTFFKVDSTVEVYAELSGESAEKWIGKYNANELSLNEGDSALFPKQKVRWLQQLKWLTIRNLRIKTNDKLNSGILILQAPIIALLITLIFNQLTIGVLFMMSISAIWFGVNNAAREIVKEQTIYNREHMFNLRIGTYLFSKIIGLLIISVLQSILFVLIISLAYASSEIPLHNLPYIVIWMITLSSVASLMGLLVSALMKTSEKVMSLVPILLIPQIMLAGVLTKIGNPFIEYLSYFTFSRWGTEGLANLQSTISFETKTIVKDVNGLPQKDSFGDILLESKIDKENAVSLLNEQFHESYNSLFGSSAGTYILDLFFLFLVGLTLFISLYMIMKKKQL